MHYMLKSKMASADHATADIVGFCIFSKLRYMLLFAFAYAGQGWVSADGGSRHNSFTINYDGDKETRSGNNRSSY